MKDNKDILNEAFFKKKSRKEALNLPQYNPVNTKSQGFLAGAYQVTDTDEVKKRLTGTFGVTFGSNNVRSMASRSVKQFPILISDNVEPETAVMLKKLMEEQYAEYISLLVSNQVIDLSDYSAGENDGNIAIQALDTLSGTQFGKSKVADRAAGGKLSADDVFGNIPLYSLLRETNQIKINTPDETVNSLLENAVILPSEYTDNMINFINENASEIVALMEGVGDSTKPPFKTPEEKQMTLKRYFMDTFENEESDHSVDVLKRDITQDAKRGFYGVDNSGNEIYTKLTTADIVVDKKRMDQAINRSVGSILTDPSNLAIRDRFEKATFLLQSRRIAGVEYYNYVTLRLGIPVSDDARSALLKNFKMGDVRDYSQGTLSKRKGGSDTLFTLSRADVKAVSENRRLVEPIVRNICKPSLGKTVAWGIAGAGAGAGTTAAIVGLASMGPLGWGALAGAAIGSGGYLISSLIKKYQARKATNRIEGWERVEALIDAMDAQRANISAYNYDSTPAYKPLKSYSDITSGDAERYDAIAKNHKDLMDKVSGKENVYEYDPVTKEYKLKKVLNKQTGKLEDEVVYLPTTNEYRDSFKVVSNMVNRALKEEMDVNYYTSTTPLSEAYLENINELVEELSEELSHDANLKAEMLSEATLTMDSLSKNPVTVKYVEKKPGKDILYTPSSFSTRTNFAYGSTEIERKENKDRRYDQPLIMTVKFKERFSDGKFADNELTAVIGILGKIIRIPSSEMEYVLKENAEGNTIEGFFKSSLTNNISDILSTSKISKDLKGMPQSADIWHNLEKVSTLAAANKISGRRNNNIANAHIVFSQKELDNVRNDMGIDYLRDAKKTAALLKRYSALTIMVANDPGQRAYIFDDQDNISWNVVPYSALTGKDSGDQLNAALSKLSRL